MQVVVISPESADSREVHAMEGLFAEGLERYHVRKPKWTAAELESWLGRLPEAWRLRIVIHQHHTLAEKLGLRGAHDRDEDGAEAGRGFSRSCHTMDSLRRSLPSYKSIFFGPVFASITKQGYGPAADFPWEELSSVLHGRSEAAGTVLALGGVTAAGLGRCNELGFDGAAVLGAVWNEPDPVRAYAAIRDTAQPLETARNAA